MSENTESFRRPDFEPSGLDMMGYEHFSPETREILKAIKTSQKQVEYIMPLAERAYSLAKSHDRFLSPVARVFMFVFGSGSFLVVAMELFKMFYKH